MTSLKTVALILRPPRLADQAAWDEIRNLPEIESLGIGPVQTAIADWHKCDYGLFAVEDRASSELIGIVGLAQPFRCAGPQLMGAIHPKWRGLREGWVEPRSVEASRAVVNWWLESRGTPLFAHVENKNCKGKRLAVALGGKPAEPSEGFYAHRMADYTFEDM